MRINLSPCLAAPYAIGKSGDTLTVDGKVFDFSAIPDGASLPREAIDSVWFAGPVERISGDLHVTLILPHGAHAPQSVRFPEPLIDVPDGPVALPGQEEE